MYVITKYVKGAMYFVEVVVLTNLSRYTCGKCITAQESSSCNIKVEFWLIERSKGNRFKFWSIFFSCPCPTELINVINLTILYDIMGLDFLWDSILAKISWDARIKADSHKTKCERGYLDRGIIHKFFQKLWQIWLNSCSFWQIVTLTYMNHSLSGEAMWY